VLTLQPSKFGALVDDIVGRHCISFVCRLAQSSIADNLGIVDDPINHDISVDCDPDGASGELKIDKGIVIWESVLPE